MDSLKDRVKAATSTDNEQQAPEDTSTPEPQDGGPGQPSTDLAARDPQLNWLKRYGTYFDDALPRHVDRDHFLATARAALPKLSKCSDGSIAQALLSCARFGLAPDGKHAAIVPYGKVATFQPMYEGFIDLMYRSGRVDSVHFGWVRENDLWDYIPSAPSPHDFVHKPRVDLPKRARGPVILAYAFCWIKGGGRSQVILLNREDAEEIRDEYSQAYQRAERNRKQDSAWHTDFDAMWAKSCVRRLSKVVPTSPELVDLLRADDDADPAPSVVRIAPQHHEEDTGEEPPADKGPEPGDSGWPEAARPGQGAPSH